ncbi:MAG: hypothetical protein JWN14_5115 [Chthonomonadales bacterium]|nr:hypothetical protein [Chthonomonadales bacterium]
MTLHLELPADVEARLTAEAHQHNLSLEDYALNKLLALPTPRSSYEETAGEAILRLSQETFGSLPPEELAKLPTDFAINHDHYIHGAPKVQE